MQNAICDVYEIQFILHFYVRIIYKRHVSLIQMVKDSNDVGGNISAEHPLLFSIVCYCTLEAF